MDGGWHMVAEGKTFRRPGDGRAEITSGLDWFELNGGVDYGETKARLLQLLQALKRGEAMVTLKWMTAHLACCRRNGCNASA